MSSSTNFSWKSGPMHLLPIPKPLSSSNPNNITIATDLSTITNIFIRTINSIYIQAPCIPLSQSAHFTTYALTIYRCLTAYDSPELARITGETQLTAVFDAPLHAWRTWLESCATRRNNFSGVICRDFMGEFMPALRRHFTALSERTTGLDVMPKGHLEKVFKGMSRTEELPAMLCNHDGAMREFDGGLSGWGRWVVRNVWAKKREEVWKFGAVRWDGRKKEVLFGKRE